MKTNMSRDRTSYRKACEWMAGVDRGVSEYRSNTSGNVALIFAICLLPLLACIGAAIDYSRLTKVHSELQSAADDAALTAAVAAVESDGNKRSLKAAGSKSFYSNSEQNQNLTVLNLSVDLDESDHVRVVAKAKLKPMFLQVFGYPRLGIEVSSMASTGTGLGAEVVIAVDATASMAFDSRWDTAMSSVESILDQMKDKANDSNFYVSLVPFQDRVNIGTHRTSWTSGTIPHNWKGCVEPREEVSGTFNWSLDDESAAMQSFAPSDPAARVTRYDGYSTWGLQCSSIPITGPTDDPAELVTALQSLTPAGTGRTDLGLAWSWRLLSSKWTGAWSGVDYPTADLTKRKKYLIFITDGNTAIHRFELSREAGFGANQGSAVLFEHIEDLCTRIKADGIEIFTLDIVGNADATPYYQRCASSPEQYYAVSSPESISSAFENILTRFKDDIRLVN